MRIRTVLLIGTVLFASGCAPNTVGPLSRSPGRTASPAPKTGALTPTPSPTPLAPSAFPVFYAPAGSFRDLDAVSWDGKPAGTVHLPPAAAGPSSPSPDGRLFLDWSSNGSSAPEVFNMAGAVVATFDIGQAIAHSWAWSPDSNQLCLVTAGQDQDAYGGGLRLLVDTIGAPARFVATVGQVGVAVGIGACDPSTDRIVLFGGLTSTVCGGGVHFEQMTATWVLRASTGAVLHREEYPKSCEPASATSVVASPNGDYLALSRGGRAVVEAAATGEVLASFTSGEALGFSADAQASLLATGVTTGGGGSVTVWAWRDKHKIWSSTQPGQ